MSCRHELLNENRKMSDVILYTIRKTDGYGARNYDWYEHINFWLNYEPETYSIKDLKRLNSILKNDEWLNVKI